jgi:uncharacterized protein YbaR (Trm112 family)/SAM-dependent methyltransferase
MVASGQQGYCPVGIDIKIEPLQAAQRVLKHHKLKGYVVAADLKQLPFQSGVFDQVYSYSVIQHVHREYAGKCVHECSRVLGRGGSALLEFPVSHGLTNFRHSRRNRIAEENDYLSWCVRYYSFRELELLFHEAFGNSQIEVDCYLGIGIRPEDIDMLPWPQKGVVFLSEAMKFLSRVVPCFSNLSDSVFVHAVKEIGPERAGLSSKEAALEGNLGILPALQCPLSQSALEYDRENNRLISRKAGKAYPIAGDIPILIPDEATAL